MQNGGSWQVGERALYIHGDGLREEVTIQARHPECDAFTVFVPSLNRERQTTDARLVAVADHSDHSDSFEQHQSCNDANSEVTIFSPEKGEDGAAAAVTVDLNSHTPLASLVEGSTKSTSMACKGLLSRHRTPRCDPGNIPEDTLSISRAGAKVETLQSLSRGVHRGAAEQWSALQHPSRAGVTEKSDSPHRGLGSVSSTCANYSSESVPWPQSGAPSIYSYHMSMPQSLGQTTSGMPEGNGQPTIATINALDRRYAGIDADEERRTLQGYAGLSRMPDNLHVTAALPGSDGTIEPQYSRNGVRSHLNIFSGRGSYGATASSGKAAYRSLHAVPENCTQDQNLLEDIRPRYPHVKAVDLLCDPAMCCGVS